MNKKLQLFSVTLVLASLALSAHADTGISATYIYIDNKGSAAWYDLQAASGLGDFNGNDFGGFTSSDTFTISGSEVNTWKNDGDDITTATLFYRIYRQGTAAPEFNTTSIGHTQNQPFTDAGGNYYSNPGDQKWAQIGSTPNILSGLNQSGTYVIEVYNTAHGQKGEMNWDLYANNGGANYTATFEFTADASSVPEPAAMAMFAVGAGLVFLVRQRRRR